jgi:outer membrane protein insertion porin family
MKEFRSTLILISSISFLLLFPNLLLAQQVAERPAPAPSYKRPVVERVDIKGVHAFKAAEIKKLLYTKPNRWFNFIKKRYLSKSNVKIDEGTIKRFYARRGYLFTLVESDITYSKNKKAIVTFYIDEGGQTTLANVSLRGGLEPINRKFAGSLNLLKVGKPINAEDITSNGFKLRDLYANNGYPYAVDSSLYSFNEDSTEAALTYAVAESVFTVNDSTRIISKGRTRHYVILREVAAKPGRMYRQKDVVDSEQRLYTTGFFKFVSLHRNDSTMVVINDTCHVGFDLGLEERKQYYVGMGFGLGSLPPLYDLVLRTSAQWGIRNIAGTGRGLVLSVKPYFRLADKNGSLSGLHLSDLGKKLNLNIVSSAIEVDYLAPWFFNFRVPVTGKVIYEPYTLFPGTDSVPAYRFDRISGEIIFSREIDRATIARLTASADYVKIRNVPANSVEFYKAQGNNQARRRLLFYVQRDTRDNFLVPQKGSYSFAGVEYVGNILGGDFNYYKMQFSWSRYNSLTGSNILATRIWVGWINDLFINGRSAITDRFLIGGSTTIRGYSGNSINPEGGRYLLLGNAEIRRPLFWRFGGTVFVDAGNAYSHAKKITPSSILFSTGLGAQFFTPVGPIRLDYAVRMKKQFDLSAGLFHFSILYAF